MRTMQRSAPLILALFILFLMPAALKADIALITRPDTPLEQISQTQIKKRWLVESKYINRQRVSIIDLDENNPLRPTFYHQIVGLSDRQLKVYWAKKVFRGEGLPPEMLATSDEVLHWVKQAPNRIGYIDAEALDDSLDDSVKVLYLHPSRDHLESSNHDQK